MYVIAQSFGLLPAALCEFNGVSDCDFIRWEDAALKIPILMWVGELYGHVNTVPCFIPVHLEIFFLNESRMTPKLPMACYTMLLIISFHI